MKLAILLIVVVLGLSTPATSVSACYRAFMETNFSGRSFAGCPAGCEAIPKNWRQHFKSLQTGGGCVRLFEQKGCTGRSIDVRAGTKANNNLRSIGWMKTSSLRAC